MIGRYEGMSSHRGFKTSLMPFVSASAAILVSRFFRRSAAQLTRCGVPVALLALAAQPLTAAVSRWSGGSANWSSTRIPGWDGSAPNAVGATVLAQGNNGAVTTTNDVSGLKVGSISLTGGS